ncbi:MAG: hypothetical protein ACI4DT_06270 [Chordicoccus sp.]
MTNINSVLFFICLAGALFSGIPGARLCKDNLYEGKDHDWVLIVVLIAIAVACAIYAAEYAVRFLGQWPVLAGLLAGLVVLKELL